MRRRVGTSVVYEHRWTAKMDEERPPKGQYLCAKQHGVTPQNNIISTTFLFTERNKNWFYKAEKP